MGRPELIAGILWLSLTAYAVLAGADFGGGVLDLFARGPSAPAQRRAIAAAMGPVWEANHVWLIFMITGLFTAFPAAFAALAVALFLPFTLVMLGIVLRGAAFAFRGHAREALERPSPWGAVFGSASVLTPLFLGASAAAVASGSVRIAGGAVSSGFWAGWTTPFAAVLALFATALCAYLAATYLVVESAGDPALQSLFRRRALAAALASGALGLAGLFLAGAAAPGLFAGLTGRALPLLLLALVNGPLAAWAVWRARPLLARRLVVAQVVFVLWAWAAAQWPYLVPPSLTIAGAAAPDGTLRLMVVVIAAGMAVLAPSLWLLFRIFKTAPPQADAGAARPGLGATRRG